MTFDIKEIKKYIQDHPNATIYIGGDSQKISNKKRNKIPKKTKGKRSRFVIAVVVYEKDSNKIFYEISTENDYDSNPGRPSLRLMNEVYKVSQIITELQDVLCDRVWECHLDINPKKNYGSNCVFQQAVGYIKGMHGISPIVKPDAFVASTVADHIVKKGL